MQEIGELKFLKCFEDRDKQNRGNINPLELRKALDSFDLRLPAIELERFVRFVEKNKQGNIDYLWLLK